LAAVLWSGTARWRSPSLQTRATSEGEAPLKNSQKPRRRITVWEVYVRCSEEMLPEDWLTEIKVPVKRYVMARAIAGESGVPLSSGSKNIILCGD